MTAASKKAVRPFRIPLWSRLRRHLLRLPPLIFWSAALIAAVVLYLRQERGFTATGFADEIRYSVSTEYTGRLQTLEVELHQKVERGQIIAYLDDRQLFLELREAVLELERLKLELGREEALWELGATGNLTERQTNLRRFARDVENAHIDYLMGLADLAENRIRLQGLELTLNRTRTLQESEFEPLATLDDDRIAFEALAERIARQEPLVEQMRQRHLDADERFAAYRRECLTDLPGSELLLAPIEYAARVQEVRIEQVNLAIAKLALRAPAAGLVTDIFLRSGEVADLGQPIVSILEPRPTEVIAYIPEHRIAEVEPGARVRIKKKTEPGRTYPSVVTNLGHNVLQLPLRLDPASTVPAWGIAVHITLPESLVATPGEAFDVIF